jgi:hypothetical protein
LLKYFISGISCGCARSSRGRPSNIGTDSSSQALKISRTIIALALSANLLQSAKFDILPYQTSAALTSPSRSPFPFIYMTRTPSPFHQLRVHSPICALRFLHRCIAKPHVYKTRTVGLGLGHGPLAPSRTYLRPY